MEEFASNSFKSREESKKNEREEIKQVVQTPAVQKKKSKISIFASDVKGIGDYLLSDVLVPAAKKAVSDLVTNGIDMLLYGENGAPRKSTLPVGRVSYQSYYSDRNAMNTPAANRLSRNAGLQFDDIIVSTRAEANEVLNEMDNIIRKYGFTRVADLYDLVGITGSYTDNYYGWSDLRTASVEKVREGYLLKFPKPMPIE